MKTQPQNDFLSDFPSAAKRKLLRTLEAQSWAAKAPVEEPSRLASGR